MEFSPIYTETNGVGRSQSGVILEGRWKRADSRQIRGVRFDLPALAGRLIVMFYGPLVISKCILAKGFVIDTRYNCHVVASNEPNELPAYLAKRF